MLRQSGINTATAIASCIQNEEAAKTNDIRYTVSRGNQSGNKADAGQKKKVGDHGSAVMGPTAPLGLAGPPGNPEQEAEGQKNTLVITRENISSVSPPSSPSSLPSDASSHSLSKECDTTSTAEDSTSFASCLTGDPSSASELSQISPVKDLTPSDVTKNFGAETCTAETSVNSVSDSVAQNITQNGVKKDSEYESAEELYLHSEPSSALTVQPSSNRPESPGTDEAQTTKQEVSVTLETLEKASVSSLEEIPQRETEVLPVAVENLLVNAESFPVSVDNQTENFALEKSENLSSTISDSLVTVTKSEIIEESVSKITVFTDQQANNYSSAVNEFLPSSECEQPAETVNTTLTLEKREVSGDINTESKDYAIIVSESQPKSVTLSDTKESETQLVKYNLERKLEQIPSEDQFDDEITGTSNVYRKENENIIQSGNQFISEDQSSSNNTEDIVKAFSEQAACQQTRDTTKCNRDSTSEERVSSVDALVAPQEEHPLPSENLIGLNDRSSSVSTLVAHPEEQPLPSENFISPDDRSSSVNTLVAPPEEQPLPSENLISPDDRLSSVNTLVASSGGEPLPSGNFIDPDDIPIIPKKSYNLDFLDNLDDPNFNPFATKTYVRISPPLSPEPGFVLPPLKPTVQKAKLTKQGKTASTEVLADIGTKTEDQIVLEKEQKIDIQSSKLETNHRLPVSPEHQSQSVEHSQDSGQLLEIAFDDSASPVKRPRKLGKKPDLKQQRQPVKKPPPKSKAFEKNNNKIEDKSISETETKFVHEDLPITSSKGYNLDFLDDLDDPNFNPFATKCSVSNSPPKESSVLLEEKGDHKSKPKVASPKKAPAKKGFTVIKNKTKTNVPAVDETDSSKKLVSDPADSDNGTDKLENNVIESAEEKDTPLPSKTDYNLDFLDDPNFDPFQSRSSLNQNITVEETDPSNKVPKNIDVAKDNSVKHEEKSDNECDKDSAIGLEKKVECNKEHLSQAPQEVKKLVINKDETRETVHSPENEEKSEVIEAKTYIEVCATSGETRGCEEKTLNSEEEIPCVIDTSPNQTDEKCKSSVEHLQLKSSQVSEEAAASPVLRNENLESKLDLEIGNTSRESKEIVLDTERETSLPKVPSIGTIGQLDSLEFAQLLGNEASRLAEEFMNCSTDSGLPDSDDSSCIKPSNVESTMADMNFTKSPQYGAHLDENINPFQKHSRLPRSPPLGKREAVCGAESGDISHVLDSFKARRSLKRENVMGEERLDTVSVDDDSGIVLGTRSDLETEVNHSEAGPEIATGLTSSDLRCASQSKTEDEEEEMCDQITDEEFLASEAFFKEATDMENQLRKSLGTPLMGRCGLHAGTAYYKVGPIHSKLSGDEVTPTKDKREHPAITPESPQNKPVPSTSSPAPPREERSAPEGTSSPTPRPSDTSERKPSSSRPTSVPPEGYMTAAEVQDLLKRQELKFEEKLLQVELAAGEKEKTLRQTMKDEQKELTTLGESMAELTQSRDALLKMVGQYKGMLASLVSEKEKDKQNADERIKAIEVERNQALEDLANVEVAFSDVHRKYERTKQVVDTLRRNEETLRGAVADYETKLQKQEQKFIEFQKHAEEKIQLANEEFEAMRKANDQEMTKMSALLKKAEMKIMSLQDAFDRKTRENQELTQLCDDLINKVGASH
ncbi:transforming acidic coiled-coil-containing protein 2 isoform X9 [Cherax quadricarinatus]|uniref:transforming acidic coiled-coil-containing protein 2 isoform X9 n=1 Tax=Cherax quadricarinatus TaxID=27406 RepID=UPI00387EE09C